ncbi:unnamed protein product [Adineta steineri]|uniref:Uncharacterized protein n=1 Tax=Adineta steineri TaxID=433720 RepID=A0A814AJB0_9BILA|nr:unnamed protein product [Adineta steineri]CAF3701813.1 unnamed protein product [Adineta steineri]
MSKRHLSVQNKGAEHEQQQQQSSSVLTRLSSKRANTNESNSTKKPKIEEKYVDKENIPKRQTRQSTKSKVPERLPSPPPPPPPPVLSPVKIIEPVLDNTTDDSDVDELEVVSDNEEEQRQAADDNGKDHPTNKQYVIYENAGPKNEPFIISKTARFWNQKYRKVLRHVNPDAFGMYIHNDFSCYGELEVVENCLLDITKAIFIVQQGFLERLNYVRKPADKINYVLGFRRIEALSILLDFTDGISGIDDGERFGEIMRVIGACYVTILRGLLPQIMFKKVENTDKNLVKKLNTISKQIPNFKQVLERALVVGYNFLTIGDVCSAYTNILQTVYCNWVFIMEKTSIDFKKKPASFDQDLWNALKHAASIDKDEIDCGDTETFDFMKELRSYKGQYGLGGDAHDLSKWTRSDRAAYSLDRFNTLDSLWF